MSSFDVIAMLKANVSDFKSGMKEAEATLTNFKKMAGSTFENIGGAMSGFGTALTVGVTAPLVAAGATAFNFAADMEDAMGATDQIFGSASGEMKKWAGDLESYYGIAESEALEYGNTMGSMLKNIGGLSEKEAATAAGSLLELAGDLTAMYGGTTESAVQALTGAMKGNNSMLDNYGMGINEAVIKAKALEMGLSDGTSELTLQAKQAATYALIMEQTADAQGQAAREAEGASGSMRALMTEVKDLATELGGVLLPIVTPFIQGLKDMVSGFKELTPEQQENIVKWAGIAAAAGPVLVFIGKIIGFLPTLITGLKILGGAFAFLTSPIGLVIAAIALVVGALVYLWNTNEHFRETVIKAWEWIKQSASDMWSAVTGFFSDMATNISEKAQQIWENVKTAFTDMVTAAIEKGTEIVESVKTSFNDAVTAAKEFVSDAVQAGVDLIMGFVNGVKQAAGNLITSVTEAVGGAIDKAKSLLGIKSPSRVFREIGNFTMLGLAEGIENNADQPIKAMQGLTKGIRDTWSHDVGRLRANVGGSIQRNVQTSVSVQNDGLNSMFAQLLSQRQYLVLDTGAFVGHTQHAYDMANGSAINLGKRVKR